MSGLVRRHAAILALLCVQFAANAYTAFRLGPVYDEPGHLVAGLSHWQYGDMKMYKVNPPLPRMVMTLPAYLMGARIDYRPALYPTLDRPEIHYGFSYLAERPRERLRILGISRLTTWLWLAIGSVVLYAWGNQMFGRPAGLASACMWAASPLVIGTSQEILPDVPAAALGILSAWAFYRWVTEPRWETAVLAGVALGIAELSKFTLILLVPVYVGVWLIAWWRRGHGGRKLMVEGAQFAALGAMALFVLGIGYNFQDMFRPLGEYEFVSDKFRGEESSNRFSGTLLERVPVPFPADYVYGIDRQAYDLGHPWPSYLRGEGKLGGWYHYYLYGLAVKEPLAFLAIMVLALLLGRWRRVPIEFSGLAMGVPLIVILCVSLQTNLNHHLRYILPAFPFLFLWCGQLVSPSMHRPAVRWLAWALLVVGIVSSARVYPYSYAYFNRLAGGPENGYRHLLDSNFCWGQDGLLVADLVRRQPDIRVSPGYIARKYLVRLLEEEGIEVQSFVPMTPEQMRAQKLSDLLEAFPPGDYVISAAALVSSDERYSIFTGLRPVRIVGYTVHIYRLQEQDVVDWYRAHQVAKSGGDE